VRIVQEGRRHFFRLYDKDTGSPVSSKRFVDRLPGQRHADTLDRVSRLGVMTFDDIEREEERRREGAS
jgi:hypothetical protein